MANLIQDFWILADSGVVLFHRVYNKNLDAQLFGGLMTALHTFAEQISKGGLSNFELNNKRFSVIKRNNFLFIADSSKDIKPKKILKELDIIATKFFKLYPPEVLDNFSGNVKTFLNFDKEIENSFQGTVKKFRNSFW